MRALTTALTALGVLLLAGCGGNPEASPPPTPSATASPSPSASATATEPPEMPKNLSDKTRRGAISAAKFFIDALNYSSLTGDMGPLRSAYVPACTRCDGIADGIAQTYETGGAYTGGEWTVRRMKFYDIQGDVAAVDAVVDYAPQTWRKSRGADPVQYAGARQQLHAFQLLWTPEEAWRVGALDPQQ